MRAIRSEHDRSEEPGLLGEMRADIGAKLEEGSIRRNPPLTLAEVASGLQAATVVSSGEPTNARRNRKGGAMAELTAPPPLPAWTGVQRPHRADARRNFDALLVAARDAFAEQGTGASLEDIARRAGVGIGTLYRNFPTRDALIEAVYVAEVEKLVEAARESGSLAPWEAFEDWLHRFVAYIGTKRVLIESLNRESDVLVSCREAMYLSGEPVMRRAQEAGAARGDADIEDVVRLMSGVAAVAYPDEQQRERVITLAIDGLRAR
jgi:AcrR family transcriptional regulator